ncbi:MAG: hypothetical protein WA813_05400 [Beijerinckiaceae bacterium]
MAAVICAARVKKPEKATAITCVFLDIGGVLLTNGWDHHARERPPMNFKLDLTIRPNRRRLGDSQQIAE